VLEISYCKCPYSHCGETVKSAALNDVNFCLKIDGALYLDPEHAYSYQVQTQMFVCGVQHCEFCVCTFPTEARSLPHIECIDEEFWAICLNNFFHPCLLPELLGNWYTRPMIVPPVAHAVAADESVDSTAEPTSSQLQSNGTTTSVHSKDNELYCLCCGPEEGSMIACDNNQYKIEWFHKRCLQMRTTPKRKCYCPDCSIPKGKKRH